jgi:hypothetical protein
VSRSRSYTRHQRERFWNRTSDMMSAWGTSADDLVRLVNAHHQNRKKCSCWMCQRSRDVLGPSPQERRQG